MRASRALLAAAGFVLVAACSAADPTAVTAPDQAAFDAQGGGMWGSGNLSGGWSGSGNYAEGDSVTNSRGTWIGTGN